MSFFFKILFNELWLNFYAKKIKGYYISVDLIPIYNWDKIENGEYEYLYKRKAKRYPEYFKHVISEMFFQFENVNTDMITKQHQLAYIKSLYVTTKNIKYYNKANFLASEINKELSHKIKKQSLNEKINFIETTFNSIGSIDKHKMDASRFNSILNKAIKKVEQLESQRNANN